MKLASKTTRLIVFSKIILFVFTFHLQAQTLNEIGSERVSLPNGWQLTPVGKILPLGDLPLNIAVSPDQRLASVTNNGQSDQSINFIDVKKGIVIQTIPIGKSWLGLTFSDDRRYLYASGGNDNIIIRYAVLKKHLSNPDTIRIGKP
jgi:DNA-binding beta-propeller fold protein YncE